jgi:hypothetical protein
MPVGRTHMANMRVVMIYEGFLESVRLYRTKLKLMFSRNLLVLGLAFLVTFSTVALAVPQLSFAPMLRNGRGSSSSLNWSGYAVTGPSKSVNGVRGSWIVPAIVGTCPSKNQYSSFWVGIDGFNSNSVEQIGTDSDCQNGSPKYYAWYEFYPAPSITITSVVVHPGDVIGAQVAFSGGRFTVTIADLTTHKSFSTSKAMSADRSSAEWIAEAPSSFTGILPLADFGTVLFGTDSTGVNFSCYASISGKIGSIGSFGSAVQQITMVTKSGAVKATPSALSTDGTSFSVQWVQSGP